MLPDDRLFMTPKLDADVLEDVVRNVVKELFDTLAARMEDLTKKLDDLQPGGTQSHRNRPRINLALPLRPLAPFSGEFGKKHSMILQGVSQENEDFASAYLESFLTGAALVFYKHKKNIRNAPTTFDEWIDALKEAFPEGRDADLHQMLIYDRRQKACDCPRVSGGVKKVSFTGVP